MKNTEFTIENLCPAISSDQTLDNILDLIREFDLEITGISF